MDYVDLYLVHWLIKAKCKDTWLALEKLYTDKRVKAISVANYSITFLEELETYASVVPVLNQGKVYALAFSKGVGGLLCRKKYSAKSNSTG